MGKFAAPETYGNFYLVAFGQEIPYMLGLEVQIVIIDLWLHPNLFDLDDLLILTVVLELFFLFKFEFAIIEDLAYRWNRLGCYFNQIQTLFLGHAQGVSYGQYALLLSAVVYQPHFPNPDLIVGSQIFIVRQWTSFGLSLNINSGAHSSTRRNERQRVGAGRQGQRVCLTVNHQDLTMQRMIETFESAGLHLMAVCLKDLSAYKQAVKTIQSPAIRKLVESIIAQKIDQMADLKAITGVPGEAGQAEPTAEAGNAEDWADPESLLRAVTAREITFAGAIRSLADQATSEEHKTSLIASAERSRKFASWSQDHLDLLRLF